MNERKEIMILDKIRPLLERSIRSYKDEQISVEALTTIL